MWKKEVVVGEKSFWCTLADFPSLQSSIESDQQANTTRKKERFCVAKKSREKKKKKEQNQTYMDQNLDSSR